MSIRTETWILIAFIEQQMFTYINQSKMKTTLFNFFKNAGVLFLIATLGMSCNDNDIEVVIKKGSDGPFPRLW